MSDSGRQRISPAELAPLATIVGVALVLRLVGLGAESLWIDESWSLWSAEGDLTTLLEMTRLDVHPPLYYLALHVWILAAGIGETALRLPSTLLSTAGVLMTWAVGRRLVGRWAALVGAAALAVSPFQIQYAQEARSYALLLLLVLVSMWFLLSLLTRSSLWQRLGWLVTMTLLLYCHYSALLLWGCQNLLFAIGCFGRRDPNGAPGAFAVPTTGAQWLGLQLACVVLWLPGATLMLEQKYGAPEDFWLPTMSWGAVLNLIGLLVGLAAPPGVALATWHAVAAFGGLILLGLTAVAFSRYGRILIEPATEIETLPGRDDALATWVRRWILGVWMIGPGALAAILSWFGVDLFTVRNLVWVAPAFTLTVAGAARRVSQPSLRTLVVALLLAVPAASLPDYYTAVRKEQWRAAGALARSRWRDGDAAVVDAWFARRCFEYYLGRSIDPLDVFTDPLDETTRVWLVRSHSRDPGRLIPRALIKGGLHRVMTHQFYGVGLELYVRARSGDPTRPQPPAGAGPEVRVVVRSRSEVSPTPSIP